MIIAGIGFFLTRFTVVLAIYEDPVRFYLAGVLPLVLGLGLAAFGVALTVADVEASTVRTMAIWCVTGAITMLILVVLTLLGSTTGDLPTLEAIRSRTYLSNFLIGGSVGGTLTGLYASRNRQQRNELRKQTNRLETLNRLLRHEVLNAVSVIKGYAGQDDKSEREAVILEHSEAIERTIDDVRHLSQWTGTTSATPSVNLESILTRSIDTIQDRYPDARISAPEIPGNVHVRATERLEDVFIELLENAVIHSDQETSRIEIGVSQQDSSLDITVEDNGPGLPESQQQLLESGDVEEFDNPRMGFGLNVARLLVESYQGAIDTSVDSDGTTITVSLPLAKGSAQSRPLPAEPTQVRPALPHLLITIAAAIIAGIFYGIAAEVLGSSVSAIGVFYGIAHPVIGWITHQFHSIVFGFVFAGLISVAPDRFRHRLRSHLLIGFTWALVLWFVAAGIISPIWLKLLGIEVPIPNLDDVLLISHISWGISLGILTAFGYRYLDQRAANSSNRFTPEE